MTSSPTSAVSPTTTPMPWSMKKRRPIRAPGWISTPVTERAPCASTSAGSRAPRVHSRWASRWVQIARSEEHTSELQSRALYPPPYGSDPMIEHDVVADLGGLPHHHAHAVVDEEASADPCPGMDLDAGHRTRTLREHERRQPGSAGPQPMGEPVGPDRVHARGGEQGRHA